MDTKRMKMNLISYGLGNAFDPFKFKWVKNREFIKPDGGLWASPVRAKYGWREWCRSESFGNLETSFKFSIDGNVFTIDSLFDALKMPWKSAYNIIEYPDFEEMMRRGVDAVYLTLNGERETRFSHPKSLYGWDCECVLVMNPNIIKA